MFPTLFRASLNDYAPWASTAPEQRWAFTVSGLLGTIYSAIPSSPGTSGGCEWMAGCRGGDFALPH